MNAAHVVLLWMAEGHVHPSFFDAECFDVDDREVFGAISCAAQSRFPVDVADLVDDLDPLSQPWFLQLLEHRAEASELFERVIKLLAASVLIERANAAAERLEQEEDALVKMREDYERLQSSARRTYSGYIATLDDVIAGLRTKRAA